MTIPSLTATSDRWADVRNVLCVRLDTIGDVLMTTPAIRAVRESRKHMRITLLTSSRGAEIARMIPEIDQVLAYDPPWMKTGHPLPNSTHEYETAELLRAGNYDGAIIFTTYTQSPLPAAMLCHLADIPRRLAHCRENPYQLLTDWAPETEPEREVRHEVQRQLDLVGVAGYQTNRRTLSLALPDAARATARQALSSAGIDQQRPWVVIHAGASAESRRYPWTGFAKAARQLVTGPGWQVVLTGDASEVDLVERIRSEMRAPSVSLAGYLRLAELAGVIAEAPLLISNNTGPVHIAAAVGTPVVVLYALTNPQHRPWGVPSRVLSHDVRCKNCYKSVCPEGHNHCLTLIPPEAIVHAASKLMVVAGRELPHSTAVAAAGGA